MYVGSLQAASTRQSWTQTFEVEDEDTGDDLDLAGASIVFEIRDPRSLLTVLSATTTNGKITIVDTGVFQVTFAASDMQSLRPQTYDVGCTVTANGATLQYIIGTIPILDGIVSTT
jgi:hypothetical protein